MKTKIAFFFIILFSILIVAPTILSFVDANKNVAFFLEINEEEENKGKEAAKDLKIKIYPSDNCSSLFLKGIQKKKNISFTSKNYISEYPKITTPPPEFLV
ncbi:hypothetical protein SAMN04487762_0263 [Polaribacter sp. Hel1_33_78]|uniref:hypothetical protein n=1 Tax=unclassified Polaribacter TaxID=196858 RepID=UPI00052BE0C8|nr:MULTISPECIES: hypothetical protein [unclassified Polaribacter]KGL59994.1 hypothetical protein PHEL49_0860 [Polaribacter sp. Hel1_33_49]MDG1194256.1 hypothetical protein [Polaribacter sp.]MDG1404027.1 hypothetical protein [Polaribacter sp.]PKV66006.1 hypothetical protein ATE90_2462 [Polaribacter sp. Hel1_33_96]SDT88494.1 hypothetical protein SAMN04487762_0263 [Polaribacter sp. Hel1_33_78]